MLELREFNKERLQAFIHSDQFRSEPHLPISFHRAISQVHNPRADEDDILLLIAYENDQLLGYLGVLPDFLFTSSGENKKIGWLSCIWVAENARGKQVANTLIKRVVELWNGNIIGTDYVPQIQKVYDRTELFTSESYCRIGVRLYIKADFKTILPPKRPFFRKIKKLLAVVDAVANVGLHIRLSLLAKTKSKLIVQYADEIDGEAAEFISKHQIAERFKRSAQDLNWMLEYPWLLHEDERKQLHAKYYFSSSDPSYKTWVVKLRNPEEHLIGLCVFMKRKAALKLLYVYHENCIEKIGELVRLEIYKEGISMFTTFHEELVSYFKEYPRPAFYNKPIEKKFIISKNLGRHFFEGNLVIQDGDGDSGFT